MPRILLRSNQVFALLALVACVGLGCPQGDSVGEVDGAEEVEEGAGGGEAPDPGEGGEAPDPGGGGEGPDPGDGGGAPDPDTVPVVLLPTAYRQYSRILFDGSRVALTNEFCLFYNAAGLHVAELEPAGGAGIEAPQRLLTAGSISFGEDRFRDGWLVASGLSQCWDGGVRPPGYLTVIDTRLPAGAPGASFTWPPQRTGATITWAVATAGGWIAWAGSITGSSPLRLLLGNLESGPSPTPIDVAGVESSVSMGLSRSGLLWTRPADAALLFVPAPFADLTPIPVGYAPASGSLDSLHFTGDFAFWLDGGDLHGLDVGRPFVPGENPRSFGPAQALDVEGPRAVWTDAGQVYTVDVSDPLSISQWISDPAFWHDEPMIAGDRIAWKRCVAATAPGTGCDADAPERAILLFDATADYEAGRNPIPVPAQPTEPFDLAVAPFGVAWTEGGPRDALYFFDPLAPVLPGANPLGLEQTTGRIVTLGASRSGLVWQEYESPRIDGPFFFHPVDDLLAQTNP